MLVLPYRHGCKRLYEQPEEVTIYDLARKLNISIATVSRALKDDPVVSKKTKKKIADLAQEMGYRSNHFAPEFTYTTHQYDRRHHPPDQQLFYVGGHCRDGKHSYQ